MWEAVPTNENAAGDDRPKTTFEQHSQTFERGVREIAREMEAYDRLKKYRENFLIEGFLLGCVTPIVNPTPS